MKDRMPGSGGRQVESARKIKETIKTTGAKVVEIFRASFQGGWTSNIPQGTTTEAIRRDSYAHPRGDTRLAR